MELVFHRHMDLMLEALGFLTMKTGEFTLESVLKRLERLYTDADDAKQLKAYTLAVRSLAEAIDRSYTPGPKDMERFFHPFSAGQGNLALMLTLSFYDPEIADWDRQEAQIIEKFRAFSSSGAPLLSSLNLFGVYEEEDTEDRKDEAAKPLSEQLEETGFGDAEKWQIYQAVHAPNKYLPALTQVLSPVKDLIAANLAGVAPLLDDFKARWEAYFQAHSFAGYLLENIGMGPGDLSGYTAHIYPCIVNGGTIALSIDDKTKSIHLQIGLGLKEGINIKTLPIESAFLLEGLKALSDKSKLAILAMIRDKRAYGQELARETGLSTATISHHIGTLINCGFICMERVENRIYYQMDKERLQAFLDKLSRYLLEPGGAPGPML